jgi:hypothetical protein
MRHRLTIQPAGEPWTRCGIQLSDHDTDLTVHGTPIDTTVYDEHVTCDDCVKGIERPRLRTPLRVVG